MGVRRLSCYLFGIVGYFFRLLWFVVCVCVGIC